VRALLHHFYRRGRTWATVFDLLSARLSHRDPPPKKDGMLHYLGCWFCIFPPRGRRKRASRFVTLALADVFSLCPTSDSPVHIFCGSWTTILSRQMRSVSLMPRILFEFKHHKNNKEDFWSMHIFCAVAMSSSSSSYEWWTYVSFPIACAMQIT